MVPSCQQYSSHGRGTVASFTHYLSAPNNNRKAGKKALHGETLLPHLLSAVAGPLMNLAGSEAGPTFVESVNEVLVMSMTET